MDNSPPIRAAVEALIDELHRASDLGAMAKACGLGRTSLYGAVRPGWNPTLSTLLAIERYLMGDTLSAEPGHPGNMGAGSASEADGR